MISNTWFYIIAGIVLLHILAGFGFPLYKIYRKVDTEPKKTPSENR